MNSEGGVGAQGRHFGGARKARAGRYWPALILYLCISISVFVDFSFVFVYLYISLGYILWELANTDPHWLSKRRNIYMYFYNCIFVFVFVFRIFNCVFQKERMSRPVSYTPKFFSWRLSSGKRSRRQMLQFLDLLLAKTSHTRRFSIFIFVDFDLYSVFAQSSALTVTSSGFLYFCIFTLNSVLQRVWFFNFWAGVFACIFIWVPFWIFIYIYVCVFDSLDLYLCLCVCICICIRFLQELAGLLFLDTLGK